jgi:hypothetical protein
MLVMPGADPGVEIVGSAAAAAPSRDETSSSPSDSKKAVSQAGSGELSPRERSEATKNLAEAIAELTKSTADLTKATVKGLEGSSRWTLLFIVIIAGLSAIAAPYLLILLHGHGAATTAEYLSTSLTGGVIAVVGILGIIVSDRGVRSTVEAVHDKNVDVVVDYVEKLQKRLERS